LRTSKSSWAVRCAVVVGFIACGGSSRPVASAPAAPASVAPPQPEPGAGTAKPTTEEKPQPDVPPSGSSIDRIMQAHFRDALLIRQAVIAGSPEDAVDPAHVLTHIQDLDQLPDGWRVFVERMQAVAGRIQDSTTSSLAAAATADLGLSCGTCHQRHGGPKASVEAAPASGPDIKSRMARHVWATERLWEGLIVPSKDAWTAGAQALEVAPFPGEVLNQGGVYARSAADDFTKLAASAPSKKTPEQRAALYAELLVTCGTCHRAMKHD
jgi:cytochrome c556